MLTAFKKLGTLKTNSEVVLQLIQATVVPVAWLTNRSECGRVCH